MFKCLLVLTLCSFSVSAQTIHFSEEKYFDSLEMTFYKKGEITFFKNKIIIVYENDISILTYSNSKLIKQEGSERKVLDLRTKPAIKMFFILFEAVYFDKKKILESYFSLKTNNGVTSLTPHKVIAKYIESVEYQKKGKQLRFLKINLTNNDRILIEENY